ncbi:MAG: tRNA (guanosine(46)-N7)-methyltransferase TrmB [Saprospiraceae bacterium]|jgi:tRNA (guanine-N7-)-methyltransferase|nr:tRNA (guanosine(46)-N7)-methyltransferase TrmB [Saprospiraceae bacterium]MBK9377504.1 tRNA (guanosine(46)-N7)-methyltransferase TrmB [Saprospiraceae bacterium]MBL0259587.1 tRNA (guanosine(46)-N7)-methyltransferase TrmB [Saprospiraceae bacterium]
MGKRTKLEKFAENLQLPNVFENFEFKLPALYKSLGEKVDFKGTWKSAYFQNAKPLVIELACGRGEYSCALAARYPEKNFIGIDIKGARIWEGAKKAMDKQLHNVCFVRSRIELLAAFFSPSEVDELWITFPDPFLKKSRSNKRLTSSPFLDLYTSYLKPSALLHLKTDDDTLYQFSLETISSHPGFKILLHHHDIYQSELPGIEDMDIRTYYEKKHLLAGKSIKYIRFQFCG